MYASPLSAICPVIDDDNYGSVIGAVVDGNVMGCGWEPEPEGFSSPVVVEAEEPLIPRDAWRGQIEEMDRSKSTLLDLIRRAGLKCKNQAQTNYCWINAPVYCVEVMRVFNGLPTVYLSPASVGAKIKNFRNQGGWGTEGLEYVAKHGVVPVDMWPANAISRSHDKPEAWARAEDFKVLEWTKLKANFASLMTALLRRQPVAIGLSWWGHEVTAINPVALPNGKFGVGCMNSWGESYGDKGYFVLSESKGTPDDAVTPRVVVPTV